MADEKWPGQEQAVPFGNFRPGDLAYETFKQGGSLGYSLGEALEYFVEYSHEFGKYPVDVDLETKTVKWSDGSETSFDETVQLFSDSLQKQSDFGLLDGPKDLGKDPSGDFPSVSWMPKGQEDLDVVMSHFIKETLSKQSAQEKILTLDEQKEIAANYGPEYNTALIHVYDAMKNQHPFDRAIEYAVNEMNLVGVTVSGQKLAEIAKVYLKGK